MIIVRLQNQLALLMLGRDLCSYSHWNFDPRGKASRYGGKPGVMYAPVSSHLRCLRRYNGEDQWEASDLL